MSVHQSPVGSVAIGLGLIAVAASVSYLAVSIRQSAAVWLPFGDSVGVLVNARTGQIVQIKPESRPVVWPSPEGAEPYADYAIRTRAERAAEEAAREAELAERKQERERREAEWKQANPQNPDEKDLEYMTRMWRSMPDE